MNNNMWNVILTQEKGDKYIQSENNPKESGRYLCTCVQTWQGKEVNRYFHVMEYDKETNHWHDVGRKNGISHSILAWTDQIPMCDVTNFKSVCGVLIEV